MALSVPVDNGENIHHLHTDYIIYKPIHDTIPYKQRIVFGGRNRPRMKTPKKKKKELAEEFSSTLSTISQSEVKDDDNAHFVLEFHSSPVSSKYERVLRSMQVRLLAFLDRSQKTALVESPISAERDRVVRETRDIIKSIRPLSVEEIVGDSLADIRDKELIIINTIPNVSEEKIREYLEKIRTYVNDHNGEAISSLIDTHNLRGSIVAYADNTLMKALAEHSSLVFSEYRIPETVLSIVKKRKKSRVKEQDRELFVTSSAQATENKQQMFTADDYEVIEIDSGIKMLDEFRGKVTSTHALVKYKDTIDYDNHGTPIAGLLLFGETSNGKASPQFSVTSFKAMQKKNLPSGFTHEITDLHSAIKEVLDNYKGHSKVFVSSINFRKFGKSVREETRKIDMLIQSKNVCFVNSAGNVDDAPDRIKSGAKKTDIWSNLDSRVFSPSDATAITSVGAACRTFNYIDSSYQYYPCCFSRHHSDATAFKPEVLEHGGTLVVEGLTTKDEGVSTFNIDGIKEERYGTSFAAPLFARILAAVHRTLKDSVNNAETLKAIAYSACRPTRKYDQYGGLGVVDKDELKNARGTITRVIFEGTFDNISAKQVPLHDVIIEIPAQPVEVELYLVHSDNYKLPSVSGNYTSIKVDGKKGQVDLNLKRNLSKTAKWTHMKKLVYTYQRNSVATWRFRLEPKLDNIPLSELPNLQIRYGGVLVIRARKVPKGYSSLKEAIEVEMKKLFKAGQAVTG